MPSPITKTNTSTPVSPGAQAPASKGAKKTAKKADAPAPALPPKKNPVAAHTATVEGALKKAATPAPTPTKATVLATLGTALAEVARSKPSDHGVLLTAGRAFARQYGELVGAVSDTELQAAIESAFKAAHLTDGTAHNAFVEGIRVQRALFQTLNDAFPGVVRTSNTSIAAPARLSTPAAPAKHPSHLPLDDLESVRGAHTPAGQMFELDRTSLGDRRLGAHMRVNLRAIEHPTYGRGYELNFDVRSRRDVNALQSALLHAGGKRTRFVLDGASFVSGRYLLDPRKTQLLDGEADMRTVGLLAPGKYQIDVMDGVNETDREESLAATFGKVRVRVYGSQAALSKAASEAVKVGGLTRFVADGDPDSRTKLDRLAVLWQRAPKLADAFLARDLDNVSLVELDRALQAADVDAATIQGLERVEVFPGYVTVIDPSQSTRYRALGVESLYHSVFSMNTVAKILAGDGLMSTEERFTRGIFVTGMSSAADIGTGGADSVFLRAAVGTVQAGLSRITLIYDLEILDRTDWYAYPNDLYGRTSAESFLNRRSDAALVSSLTSNNEFMFRRGIANRYLRAIYVSDAEERQTLLADLRKNGVTSINGRPLDECIEVRLAITEAENLAEIRKRLGPLAVTAKSAGELKKLFAEMLYRNALLAAIGTHGQVPGENLQNKSIAELEQLRAKREKSFQAAHERSQLEDALRALGVDEDANKLATLPLAELRRRVEVIRDRRVRIARDKELAKKNIKVPPKLTNAQFEAFYNEVTVKLELLNELKYHELSGNANEPLAVLQARLRDEIERRKLVHWAASQGRKIGSKTPLVKARQTVAAIAAELRREAIVKRLTAAGYATKGKTIAALEQMDFELERRMTIERAVGTSGAQDIVGAYEQSQKTALAYRFQAFPGADKLPVSELRRIATFIDAPSARSRTELAALTRYPVPLRLCIVAAMIPSGMELDGWPGLAELARITQLDKEAILKQPR